MEIICDSVEQLIIRISDTAEKFKDDHVFHAQIRTKRIPSAFFTKYATIEKYYPQKEDNEDSND